MKTVWLGCLLAVASMPLTAPVQQDQIFRLQNLERRCDQLQQRVDFLERQQQTQALAPANDANRELLIEFQRQLLSLNQQLLEQQRQQLELRKAFDQQTERLQALEKRIAENKPEVETKPVPKAAPRRP